MPDSNVQSNGLRIVCDPWLTGLAFNQSWALLTETRFQPGDFEGVDYIWFSHEHPDHFSPPDLRSIPERIRSNITILFKKPRMAVLHHTVASSALKR